MSGPGGMVFRDLILQDETNIEGTVGVISSDPPFKDGIARVTTVPLKALSDQVYIIYQSFVSFKL